MGRIPEHVIDQIAKSTDMVRLVGQYVKLVRKGARFWGLCPFHEEKSPSFTISPEKGVYKCFGCNEGGSVFTFLMKVENLSFVEAVKNLAGRCGVDLTPYEGRDPEADSRMARLRELHEFAADVYARALTSPAGAKAAAYVRERRISADSVARWRLGCSPAGWTWLIDQARRRGFSPGDLVEGGLAVEREESGKSFDRFRDRLMFPIMDRGGQVIGFGSRQLEGDSGPKYMNSPETPLFSKRRYLYGLSHAKEAIRSLGKVVIVEGYVDVIMSHQFGLDWVVGVLGTALTEDHARELKRLCETVILVFDPDQAGQKAAAASVEVLLAQDMRVLVAILPGGMDPDELLLARGADAMRYALDTAVDFFEYRLKTALAKVDGKTLAGQQAIFEDLLPLALASRDPARRDLLVRQIAREIGIAENTVWSYVREAEKARRTPRRGGAEGETGGAAKPAGARADAISVTLGEIAGLVMTEPALAAPGRIRELIEAVGDSPEKRLLAEWAAYLEQAGEAAEGALFAHRLTGGPLAALAADLLEEEDRRAEKITGTRAERLEGCIEHLGRHFRRQSIRQLKQGLNQAQSEDHERDLLRRIAESRRTGPDGQGRG